MLKFIMNIPGLFFILVIVGNTFAQTDHDFTDIDRWAAKQKLHDTAIVDFTKNLIFPAENDFEKIRAIYQFVTHYLSYDQDATVGERRRINQHIYDIVTRRKGICWDYAALICSMAEIAGIPCYMVTGFSKDLNQPSSVNTQPDHAWNLVRIDSNYYLLDATWESNTLIHDDAFKQMHQTDYFLTAPELFIKNHFPSIPAFQLLSCPLIFDEFVAGIVHEQSTSCQFDYQDSLKVFLSQSYLDQKIAEMASIYHAQTNPENNSAWGHALIDKAIIKKENADLLFEQNKYAASLPIYEIALINFNQGSEKTDLYPWQAEAKAFCHLNYAQVIYRINQSKGRSLKPVIMQLKIAKSILEKLNSKSFQIKSALIQIDNQLAAIE